ncbi:hypothetical protein HanRHA438_Chr10g0474811 [Helianthus annuus]|nr:hypothetical protein HanIR_Chr10g0498211 [Helianthus annuus]KAJ0881486.1 hypothetical protein HanRHA438_Chr10g0474811 [Helianthus annuus]
MIKTSITTTPLVSIFIFFIHHGLKKLTKLVEIDQSIAVNIHPLNHFQQVFITC